MAIECHGKIRCSVCNKKCKLEQLMKQDGEKTLLFSACATCRENDITIENKKCKCCNNYKLKSEFYKLKTSLSPSCRDCYKDNYRLKHPKGPRKVYSGKRTAKISKTQFNKTFSNQIEYKKIYNNQYHKTKQLDKQLKKTIDAKVCVLPSLTTMKVYSIDIYSEII